MHAKQTQDWARDMAKARLLVQTGKPEEAREIVRCAQSAAPTLWQGLVSIASAEIDCGNLDAARKTCADAAAARAPELALVQLEIHRAIHQDDAKNAISLAKGALAKALDIDLPTLLALGECAIENGDMEDAELFADIALESGCDLVRLHRIKYTCIILRATDDALEGELRKCMFAQGTSENHAVCLPILHRFRTGDPDTIYQLTAEAAVRWPTSGHVALVQKQLEGADRKNPQNPAEHFDIIAGQLGELEVVHPALAGLKNAFSKLDPSDLSRPLLQNHDPSGVSVTANSGTGDLMVFFSGIGADVTKLGTFDAYMSTAGFSGIYLTDPRRLLCCNGIPVLGKDLDETLAAIQGVLDGFGPRRSLTMVSTSGGGIGALLYGLRLKADRILCYSPPTFVNRQYLEAHRDKRARAVVHRLEKHVRPERLDIMGQMEATKHRPVIDLVYAAEHAADRSQAEYLRGKPGVSLYPIAGYDGHPTIQHAMMGGYLMDTLRGEMSSVPV